MPCPTPATTSANRVAPWEATRPLVSPRRDVQSIVAGPAGLASPLPGVMPEGCVSLPEVGGCASQRTVSRSPSDTFEDLSRAAGISADLVHVATVCSPPKQLLTGLCRGSGDFPNPPSRAAPRVGRAWRAPKGLPCLRHVSPVPLASVAWPRGAPRRLLVRAGWAHASPRVGVAVGCLCVAVMPTGVERLPRIGRPSRSAVDAPPTAPRRCRLHKPLTGNLRSLVRAPIAQLTSSRPRSTNRR